MLNFQDEPEVEYVDNYDNGSNSTISIDMRKDETNENFDTLPSEDTKDKENIEIEEKVEIEVDDDLQPEIEKSVEKLENEMTDEIDVAKGTQDDTYNLETKKTKNENENKIEVRFSFAKYFILSVISQFFCCLLSSKLDPVSDFNCFLVLWLFNLPMRNDFKLNEKTLFFFFLDIKYFI